MTLFREVEHTLEAEALEDTSVYTLSSIQFESISQGNVNIAIDLMKWLCDYIRKIQSQYQDLLLYGKKGPIEFYNFN